MKAVSLTQRALQALSEHRELIEEVYDNTTIHQTTDNARAITVLQKFKILIPDGRNEYHLSRDLVVFLNAVNQRQRMYESMGENLGGLHARILNLKSEYIAAAREGHVDEIDTLMAQFHDACNDLADSITFNLASLLGKAENHFGLAASRAAKTRENRFYLNEAKKLSDSISVLERSREDWDIYENLAYEDITSLYQRLITDRLSAWNQEAQRINAILADFLFKQRKMAEDVRRLRAFADYLHQNPGYEPPDFTEDRNLPDWLLRAPGIQLSAAADVQDAAAVPELESIALKLPAAPVTSTRKRQAGTLVRASSTEKTKMAPAPAMLEMMRFVGRALKSPKPLSARSWFREEAGALQIPEDLWLFIMLSVQESNTEPFNQATFTTVDFRGLSPLSKNLFVRDILVHGKKTDSKAA